MASAAVSDTAGLSTTTGGTGWLAVATVDLELVLHSVRMMHSKNIRRQMSLFIVIYVNPIKIMEKMKWESFVMISLQKKAPFPILTQFGTTITIIRPRWASPD